MEEIKSQKRIVKFKLPDGRIKEAINFNLDFLFEKDKMRIVDYQNQMILIYKIDERLKEKYLKLCKVFNIPFKINE